MPIYERDLHQDGLTCLDRVTAEWDGVEVGRAQLPEVSKLAALPISEPAAVWVSEICRIRSMSGVRGRVVDTSREKPAPGTGPVALPVRGFWIRGCIRGRSEGPWQ